jgi:DNA mismatch endonuclease (patch repair protein)
MISPRVQQPYPNPSSVSVTAVMRANRKTDTAPELRLRRELHRRGLRFRKHLRIQAGEMAVRPDVVFSRQRVAVFIDGCFWHGCPQHGTSPKSNAGYWTDKLARNQARDRATGEALTEAGWTVIRIWEHTAVVDAVERIVLALAEPEHARLAE